MFLRFLKGEFQKLPFTPFETIIWWKSTLLSNSLAYCS